MKRLLFAIVACLVCWPVSARDDKAIERARNDRAKQEAQWGEQWIRTQDQARRERVERENRAEEKRRSKAPSRYLIIGPDGMAMETTVIPLSK
jgi:Ni/Co efflux regulator RcnB